MTLSGSFKWIATLVLAAVLLPVLFVAVFGWNWLRGPIERMALQKSGRVLAISGDIQVDLGWPAPRLRAGAVTFANPVWAREQHMVAADTVEVVIDLPQLFRHHIVLPEVRLGRPVVLLEQGPGGRKNWLLDLEQRDESARIRIDRLMLDNGTLGYDDAAHKTSIRAQLSTSSTAPAGAGLTFSANGRYQSLPFRAVGAGGPVLGLRDENMPYPLKAELEIGHTVVRADGTVTSVLRFSAIDMHLAVRGDSLAQLFPLLGIAFPETRSYKTDGRIVRSGTTWRYENFAGHIGESDIAGTLQVITSGKRPAMTANLVSRTLDFADLGPLIGARPGSVQAAKRATLAQSESSGPVDVRARVLPDLPFKSDRWDSVDAEVTLKARTIRRAKELPLENLVAHLSLRDAVLTLDPLDFGVAGGHLSAVISLNGQQQPIQARAKVKARKLLIAKLLPAVKLASTGIGELNGEFDLTGKGNSVGQMLASANGKLGLVVAGGEISQLMMERAGLHLWEVLGLTIGGDKLIKLRCGIADFDVKQGVMHSRALVFDTEVTTIAGTGTIDLGQERLDLTLNQETKNTSPLALRSPVHVRGSFANPTVGVDKGRVAMRALGAIALGMVNPFLALIPLIDAGPGKDSDCGRLLREAKVPAVPAIPKKIQAPGRKAHPGAGTGHSTPQKN